MGTHADQTMTAVVDARGARGEDIVAEPRKEVQWFAEQMEAKLRKNDHKSHWSDETPHRLLYRLLEEVAELATKLQPAPAYSNDIHDRYQSLALKINAAAAEARIWQHLDAYANSGAIGEAADIANFAMMIADNINRMVGKHG